jgi:predicted lipoprotein with Yx(FWY)xxD motif
MKPALCGLLLTLFWTASAWAQTAFQIQHHAIFGPYLTDGQGRALYVYSRDMRDVSTCVARCNDRWPRLEGERADVKAPLKPADFNSFRHARGPYQLTFRGAPLYYYAGDKGAGDTKGNGENGQWSLVNPESFSGLR